MHVGIDISQCYKYSENDKEYWWNWSMELIKCEQWLENLHKLREQ